MVKKIILITTFFALITVPLFITAVEFIPKPVGDQDLSFSIRNIITKVMNAVIWPAVVTGVIICFIVAGFKFLTAKGNPEQLETARRFLIWGVVGLALIILSFSVVQTIQSIIDISQFDSEEPPAEEPPPEEGGGFELGSPCQNDAECASGNCGIQQICVEEGVE